MTNTNPSTQSADYRAMADYWRMVDDIMGGAPAMRAAKTRYLPQFEDEPGPDYARRLAVSPFTPLYDGSFRNLASKPFSKEVRIGEDAPEILKKLVEDIDGAGNHLHVVAREVFKGAINYGCDWLLVDHTAVPAGVTLGDERAMGARPYWVRIPAKSVIAVYEGQIGGETVIVHARIAETETVRDGFDEKTIERVREFNHDDAGARWTLWRKDAGNWSVEAEGVFSIGLIPLVPMFTGEREGNGFAVRPPLRDLAHMQITEYQMEANLAYVQTNTTFSTHVFQGVDQPLDETGKPVRVSVGPRTVVFLPFDEASGNFGDYKQVEPSGTAAKALREDLDAFRKEMREAGMQPLLPQSGNLTATATAVAEAKAHSAVEAWALALKDVLEQAFVYTCMWLGLPKEQAPDVIVNTDFAVGEKSVEEMGVIDTMYERELLSGEQYVEEALRRGILAPTYNREKDEKLIEAERPDDDDLAAAVLPPVVKDEIEQEAA